MKTKKKSAFDNGKMSCAYCPAIREQIMFCIGASRKADWVINEGTGKVSCPACWELGKQEGKQAIENHINHVNSRTKHVVGK